MEIITSRQNPRIKEVKKLIADKKARAESGLFWVDGVNFVAQAIENTWEIETLVYVPELVDSDFKKKVVEQIDDDRWLAVNREIYADLATKKDIQGIGAVVRQKISKNTLFDGTGVVLENIANPGNLGSIVRLCAAFSVTRLYVVKPAVDFFNPETVRASMGAIFHLGLVYFDSTDELVKQLTGRGFAVIGTSLQDDSVDLAQFKPRKISNRLFLFGSEAKGLSGEAREMCDSLVKIPISEAVDSLNIAESAAIVLYELVVKK
ncbi:MAG: RNA methyltransferase [Microgenomates group bacterium]